MYINKVDELIDQIIEDFYTNVILGNKVFDKFKGELNFIKSQKDINDILVNYIKTIPKTKFRNVALF